MLVHHSDYGVPSYRKTGPTELGGWVMNRRLFAVFLVVCMCTCLAGVVFAQSTAGSTSSDQLGDVRLDRASPLKIQAAAPVMPVWSDLFNADGSLRYALGPGGVAGANGIADAIDRFGGQGALFVHDGKDVESPAEDVRNIYAFLTSDGAGQVVIFGGVELLAAEGSSRVEYEFNQDRPRYAVIHDPSGDTIRPVVESRRPGDMLVRWNLGADGSVLSTEVLTWSVDLSGSGADGYRTAETAPGEGCSTAQSTCVFTNAETIQGGPWLSNDLSADGTSLRKATRLLEFVVT